MWFTTIIYLIIPFFQASSWCLTYLDDNKFEGTGVWLDCKTAASEQKIPYSGIPMADPYFTCALGFLCLAIFSTIKTIRCKRSKRDTISKRRDVAFFVMVGVACVDMVIGLILIRKDYVAEILRPLIIVTLFRS